MPSLSVADLPGVESRGRARSRPRRPLVAVGYSGGRDSTALLHATLAASATVGVDVIALHVHHGLSANADAWLEHCRSQCERWRRRGFPVTFEAYTIADRPAAGESVEAWARERRYAALTKMAREHEADLILLAHHQRDQAETVLLQALRGAGVSGLAGMPSSALRDGITWARPWLGQPRESIDAYVRRHRLRNIDDESNSDPRWARSRLRREVWPVLSAAFDQADAALAQCAGWMQQAGACLDELAALDLQRVAESGSLRIKAWSALSGARRVNALRVWLKAQIGRPASASLVTRLGAELATARHASWPCTPGVLRLYRGVLTYRLEAEAGTGAAREARLHVVAPGDYPLPGWAGCLRITPASHGGVPAAWLGELQLRARAGGEKFQAGPGRPARSLKKQYQAAAIPEWQRDGPLLFSGGRLLYVPGLGPDARALALPGQPQVKLEWVPLSRDSAD